MTKSLFDVLFYGWLLICACVEIVGFCIQSETVMVIGAVILFLPMLSIPIVMVMALGSPLVPDALKQRDEYK